MDPITPTPTPSPTLPPLGAGISAVETGPAVAPAVSAIPENIPQSPKRRFNFGMLGAIAALFVLLAGTGAAYFLTQQNQDVRNQASTGAFCSLTRDGGPLPYGCDGKSTGVEHQSGDYKYNCIEPVTVSGDGTPYITCKPQISQIFCAACNSWKPASGGGCNVQCPSGNDGGVSDNETSPGEDEDLECGGDGQRCCDPKNRAVCDGSLYCNTESGKCQGSIPGNICSPSDSAGGTLDPNKCIVCSCGSSCNKNNECTLNCEEVEGAAACEAATQELLSPSGQCGQVDFVNQTGAYCGVKAIKCDGSCAPSNPPTPAGSQCTEIVGRIGIAKSNDTQAVAPRIGDDFFLKCRKVAGASGYRFRYFYTKRSGSEAYQSLLTKTPVKVGRNPEFPHISQNIQVTHAGFYYGQCKVCMPDASSPTGQNCGKWEPVTNSARRLPFQEEPPLVNDADGGDGFAAGSIPNLRPIRDYFADPADLIEDGASGSTDNVVDPIIGNPVGTE